MWMYNIGKLHILFSKSFITNVQTSLPCRHLFSSFLCIPYPQYIFNKIISFASEKTSLKCILLFHSDEQRKNGEHYIRARDVHKRADRRFVSICRQSFFSFSSMYLHIHIYFFIFSQLFFSTILWLQLLFYINQTRKLFSNTIAYKCAYIPNNYSE